MIRKYIAYQCIIDTMYQCIYVSYNVSMYLCIIQSINVSMYHTIYQCIIEGKL